MCGAAVKITVRRSRASVTLPTAFAVLTAIAVLTACVVSTALAVLTFTTCKGAVPPESLASTSIRTARPAAVPTSSGTGVRVVRGARTFIVTRACAVAPCPSEMR